MLPRTSRLATMALGLSLAAACSSATVPDAGFAPDAIARPDAVVVTDTGVTPADTGVHADAGEVPDTGDDLDASAGGDDALVPSDDAGPRDTGPADSGTGPCGTLDPAQGPAAFTSALGEWLSRCNPELTPNEVGSISAFIAFTAAPAFENTTLTYDPVAGGQCACAIAAAPCDNLAWFRGLASCDAAFVSTATTHDPCSTDFDCPSAHRCRERLKGVAFGGQLPPTMCGGGDCWPVAGLGEDCTGEAECAPGTYCDSEAPAPTCTANAALGEDCNARPCLGDTGQTLIFPPNACHYAKGPSVCEPRGRTGGLCGFVPCHDLYRCDNNLTCQALPGEGEACVVPFEVNPSLVALELQLHESRFSCRGNIGVGLGAAALCVLTSTDTGAADCRLAPALGERCGVGNDLTPFCAPGAYCRDVVPGALEPVVSVCIPQRVETSTCSGRWLTTYAPNQECEAGTTCQFDFATGESRCADECADTGGGS